MNLAAGQISIRYGFKGPIGAPVTACAAGVQAIGDGARLIRAGEADVAVCGGTEACINSISLGGFAAARSLSTGFNDTPASASRPFDIARDGFVMGEGAGIVVVEALDHALARGATPLAELVGYGTTADAYHITSGPEDGDGARRAIEIAIDQAGIRPSDIKHVNAHATSTPVGDKSEIEAIKAVFGRESGVAVSANRCEQVHMAAFKYRSCGTRRHKRPVAYDQTYERTRGRALRLSASQAFAHYRSIFGKVSPRIPR